MRLSVWILTLLARIPPWEWPPNGGDTLRAVLGNPQAAESDRLLAAELAAEPVAIDDDLAGGPAGDRRRRHRIRTSCARGRRLSLGPVLEQMDERSGDYFLSLEDETLAAPPISEHTFQRIQESLRARYREDRHPQGSAPPYPGKPRCARSRRLATGRRFDLAYSIDDRDWRLTAVFAMRWGERLRRLKSSPRSTTRMKRSVMKRYGPPATGKSMPPGRTYPPCSPRRPPTRRSCSPPSKPPSPSIPVRPSRCSPN